MILLGWEIATGRRVEIPETGHLAWFGQTQLSGKTTALEAIAFRGELKAVAFITKQGEGGFLTGRMIPPYFSEPTNDEEQPLWRWVKSILEAGQQRRMNFEESWIIRACEDPRQAKTLADVHRNIKDLIGGEGDYIEKGRGKKKKREWKYTRKPVTGINAGVYTSLKAYFDIVMPQLARLPYTKKLVLGPGLNVMDLREYAMETQALVIRSVMEWVYQHEKGVRVIVPEAQDFVPQGKNSPVKMACETLVRKAGANRNFMWLDSQDMAAVDKIMLRACSIVGIGVQTEGHEIERSLAGLFTPALRPVDIARLKIGEFFVRTPEARVQKCYVQPAWMESELHAQAIAKGEENVSSARQMLRAFKNSRNVVIDDGTRTAGKTTPLQLLHAKPHQLLQVQIQEPPVTDTDEEQNVEESESVPHADLEATEGTESADRNDRAGDSDGHVGGAVDRGALRRSGSRADSEDEFANLSETGSRQPEDEMRLSAPVSTSHVDRGPGNENDHATIRTESFSESASQGRDSRQSAIDKRNPSFPQSQIDPSQAEGPVQGKKEPGKHEETTNSGIRNTVGTLERAENASETVPLDEAVSGAPLSFGGSENHRESERAMPPKQTPFESLKAFVDGKPFGFGYANPEIAIRDALRDLLKDHAALIEAHDALARRVKELQFNLECLDEHDRQTFHVAIARRDALVAAKLDPLDNVTVPPRADFTGHGTQATDHAINGHGLRFTVPDLDYIWKYVKAKAEKDSPAILELLTRRPELRIKVERQTVQMDDSQLIGRIARLLHEGWFAQPKNGPAVQKELKRRGCEQPTTNLYKPLNKLTEMGFLTLESDGYREVAEMKALVQKV